MPGTDGDFHSPFEGGDLRGRLAGLIDINHATNFQFIRTPVNVGDSAEHPRRHLREPGGPRQRPLLR